MAKSYFAALVTRINELPKISNEVSKEMEKRGIRHDVNYSKWEREVEKELLGEYAKTGVIYTRSLLVSSPAVCKRCFNGTITCVDGYIEINNPAKNRTFKISSLALHTLGEHGSRLYLAKEFAGLKAKSGFVFVSRLESVLGI
ncbi:MAG: hypothetical protein WCI72_02590 [archaeon]